MPPLRVDVLVGSRNLVDYTRQQSNILLLQMIVPRFPVELLFALVRDIFRLGP